MMASVVASEGCVFGHDRDKMMAEIVDDFYGISDPLLTTNSGSASMSTPCCSFCTLQPIQYNLRLFTPSLLGNLIRG